MPHDVALGVLIADENQQRDAIHIAVAPVVAYEKLAPGQDIGLVDNETALASTSEPHIGIVDPFLKHLVFPGQRFWMFLYPQTVTGMRHHWAHPAFEGAPQAIPAFDEKAASEAWIKDFAEQVGVSYKVCMVAAEDHLISGDYFILSYDTPSVVWQMREEFWKHYAIVTGKEVKDTDATFFSCSC